MGKKHTHKGGRGDRQNLAEFITSTLHEDAATFDYDHSSNDDDLYDSPEAIEEVRAQMRADDGASPAPRQ